MKFKCKTKKLFKNISLGLLGLGAIGAIGVGATKIVEYAKNDLNTIHPTFEIGGLGNDGTYVDEELSLYTKDSFRCDGLQAKLDFDSEISYQFFYYDDLGNFMDKTETYTKGDSFVPLGTYARCVITPLNDEDGKISLKERITYPSQLHISVSKKQNSSSFVLGGRTLITEDNFSNLIFEGCDLKVDGNNVTWGSSSQFYATTKQLFDIGSYKGLKLNYSNDTYTTCFEVFEYKVIDNQLSLIKDTNDLKVDSNFVFNKDTQYILIKLYEHEGGSVTELSTTELSNIINGLYLTK